VPGATADGVGLHFGLLRKAMAPHDGREVKRLANGLMLVFPSLLAALDGSVAMQRAVADNGSSGAVRSDLRIGLSGGDATEADGDFSGSPVAEAARLCARAEAGHILTTELIARMARRTGHTFTPVGAFALREDPDPVPAVALQWIPAVPTSG
jgi:class 3 adenylate cyclase